MLNQDHKILDYSKKNKVIIKNINLDFELDLFLLISSNDANLAELILNKTLDFSIDNISKEKTEKDLGIVLENINSILKTWRQDNKELFNDITIFLGALNKNKFYFSNIGKPSAYLVKKTNEVVEITEKEEKKKEFNFISSGNLDYGDSMVLASSRLLAYLSYSDFNDSSIGKKAEAVNKNIETILEGEKVEENIGILTFKYNYSDDIIKESKTKEKLHDILMKILDNNLVKSIIGYYRFGLEKIEKQSSFIKNYLYIGVVIIAIFGLVYVADSIVGSTIQTKNTDEYKQNLTQVKEYIKEANNNTTNPDIFDLNIKKAEDLIDELRDKNVFLNDLDKLNEDIAIIKKQFNQIETYEEKEEDLIYQVENKDLVKVLKVNKKLYLVTNKNIVGPIISGKSPTINAFSELGDDYFIDATYLGESIILITKNGKVVEFAKNGYFSYKDVKNQVTWEESNIINSYGQKNIYLVEKEENQIFKHVKDGSSFSEGVGFLKEEDINTIGKIKDIAIDGGIYILKNDLSIIKAFSSPYRLESIMINKLPKNYEIESDESNIKIYARNDLKLIYILLNNKIWVLQPNTTNYKDTKNLTYLGQIEGLNYKIENFYVDHDGEIEILNENGIYKLTFEINDDKIIVR